MKPSGPRKLPALLIFLILIIALAGCLTVRPDQTLPETTAAPAVTETTAAEPTVPASQPETAGIAETTAPEPEPAVKISTATITTTGDLLMHIPVINSGLQADGSYDYTEMFRYISPYVTAADWAVANLETTLCGTENGFSYSGYPKFNCPDGLVDSAAAAGFDLLLTANNHCNDTGSVGFNRTLQIIADRGLASLGTRSADEERDYRIVELNGISIGMICYTYGTILDSGLPAVNGLPLEQSIAEQINVFDYDHLEDFYSVFRAQMESMTGDGAEAVVLFIHWGQEYQLSANSWQKSMAQALCDLGVDVIIGNHPHVVQAAELLTSALDEGHKTVCLYSTGNTVSNQRQGSIASLDSAHTEDGVLFSVTFAKYSDGTVRLDGTEVIPLWVNRRGSGSGRTYSILPLDPETMDDWQSLYGLRDAELASAIRSYDRTMDQLGSGFTDCQDWLAANNQQE